jgi:hypothetical protein
MIDYNTAKSQPFYQEVRDMHINANKPFSPQQVLQMRDNSKPSQRIDDFLNMDEFNFIQSRLASPEWQVGVDGADFLGIDDDYADIKNIILPKLHSMFGNFNVESFFVRKSTTSLLVHTDHRWDAVRVPYKTLLIPLQVDGNWNNVGTVTYNQYQYVYTLPKDENGFSKQHIKGLTNQPFDLNNIAHVSHENILHLEGLSIESCLTWKPRSLLAFDSTRLHSSNDWFSQGVKSKWAITLLTSI